MLASYFLGAFLLSAGFEVQPILGAAHPGKYKHPASITELANGDLYVVYYGGQGEYEKDSTLYGSRRARGATAWTKPIALLPRPPQPEGNPVVWQAPDGVVWLFSVMRPGKTWSSSWIMARISTDGAQSWQEPYPLRKEPGSMVRGKPIVLASGDYLLPIYHETGEDPERVAPDTSSLFMRYDPKSKKWSESNKITSRIGNLQPAPAEISPGHLLTFCRRGGDYSPRKDGFIVRSESRDGGLTWAPGNDTDFPNPNAAVDLLKLASGKLALFFNDSQSKRTPLTIAVSTDAGKTFVRAKKLADGPGDFAYPYAIQARDGRILCLFTSERRTVINLATFDEAWLSPPK